MSLIVILILLSFLSFLIGYAFIKNKSNSFLDWGISKKVKDKEGFKKQQGTYTIIIGAIFLLVPVTIYFVEQFNLNPQILYFWIFVLLISTIINTIKVRKYY
ncbi:hypothetical protein ACTWQB_01435 [Piscibacillus sp. B03]|uniref:hypothetical protein n=1 Tax=Piscibacillus sp. B03 TaxID=3457430 RepID=UPI003FCCF5BA